MASNKKNLIITAADINFIDQAKQLFSSVYFNAGWQGDYLLLTHDLSAEDTIWFETRGIIVYDQPLVSTLPVGDKKYSPIILSKFYFFQEYFKKWQKIIFLDADILVYASLDNLLKLTGFNAPEAIPLRLRDEFISDKKRLSDLKKSYNLNSRAFSTGVFVFDTDLIQPDTFSDIISIYNKYEQIYQYGEESILNLFFYKNWKMLPMTYNSVPWYLHNFCGLDKDKILAFVVHFVCEKIKPWNSKSLYHEEWQDNLNRAEEIDLNNRPKARKILNDQEVARYLRYVKIKENTYYIRVLTLGINKQIGLLGLFIKKKSPKLYSLISFKKDGK